MGKKVRKYAAAQDFTKRKREKEAEKESPFSSIVLKEKKEAEKKPKAARVEKKRAGEVIQGYDPNASFADILANYERTGNPYAMPKKKNVQSESLSFGDILDKWEGKDKKKRPQNEVKKSTYKATKSFAEILSQYEGNPVREDKTFIIDEDVAVSIVEKEEKGEESPLFKKESECETRSPDASWSIYGNNESFERKMDAPSLITEEVGTEEKKPEKAQKKSTYKATKDFGEILKGFYSGQAEMEGEQKTDRLYIPTEKPVGFVHETIDTRNTHGTGCTLSSAIAACLALGYPLPDAVSKAEKYLAEALRAGKEVMAGHGHGPVNHFYSPQKLVKRSVEK